MSEHVDAVAVQYPRGTTTLVWLDLVTGAVATNHSGLRETLRRGIKDWTGVVIEPDEGRLFLSAVYDHFFLNRYSVCWLSISGLKGVHNAYRV
ncbi:MAG TPA: hypothetical protein VJ746_06885 [Nitrospira sp.]|nr:hypothetical protein [Nitrospira sp.]